MSEEIITKPFCWNCGGGKNGEKHLEECDSKDDKFMMVIKVQVAPKEPLKDG